MSGSAPDRRLARYEPMLAVRWDRLFTDDGWRYELKWDGVRTILSWDGTSVETRSRRGTATTATYPELHAFATDRPVVLDGEIVALDESGRPSFERLQSRMNVRDAAHLGGLVAATPISLVVFDLLVDGAPILDLPWEERRSRLESLTLPAPCALSSIAGPDPTALWDFVLDRDLEGVVAKRLASPYRPGVRSGDWRKISAWRSVRAIVGGFTPGAGARADTFGSLQLGLYRMGKLRWIGSVGSGFSRPEMAAIRRALDEMTVEGSPFEDDQELPEGVRWVSPALVALVRFKEWTSAGRLRAPSFKGFTNDEVSSMTWSTEGPDADR